MQLKKSDQGSDANMQILKTFGAQCCMHVLLTESGKRIANDTGVNDNFLLKYSDKNIWKKWEKVLCVGANFGVFPWCRGQLSAWRSAQTERIKHLSSTRGSQRGVPSQARCRVRAVWYSVHTLCIWILQNYQCIISHFRRKHETALSGYKGPKTTAVPVKWTWLSSVTSCSIANDSIQVSYISLM